MLAILLYNNDIEISEVDDALLDANMEQDTANEENNLPQPPPPPPTTPLPTETLVPVQVQTTTTGNDSAAPPTLATHPPPTVNTPQNQFVAINENGRGEEVGGGEGVEVGPISKCNLYDTYS